MNIQQTNYRNYSIEIFELANGDEMHISKGDFYYQAKTSKGNGMSQAQFIIDRQEPAVTAQPSKYNIERLNLAKQQLISNTVIFLDEKEGARQLKSIEKAYDEILNNDSIEFDGNLLTFISRESGKARCVTAFGCHESCQCGGGISYHRSIFELLARYQRLSNVRAFPVRRVANFKMAEVA